MDKESEKPKSQSKMKKWIKRLFFIFGGFFLVLILLGILIPIIFKKDIKAKIDEEIAKSVNAHVYFDIDKFGLSMFSNFPNITVSMEDFGVVGKDQFKGDTLTAVKEFEVEVDIWSVLFSDKIQVRGIYLDSPKIYAKVLKDGTANWDIMKADTTQKDEKKPEKDKSDTTQTNFNVGIKRWKIKNADIVYADAATPMYASITKLTHKGSGNFTQAVFDLKTKTTVDKIDFGYENVSYVENKSIDVDLTLNMDMEKNKFTFKQNAIKINEFVFKFDGFVQMVGNDINMDIKYAAKENEFKNILSLVPGVYTEMEEFQKMKTEGKFAFDGFVKGTYNEKKYPAFGLNFKVSDALFQYPDLPTPVNNINVDVSVGNKTSDLEKTVVDLKKLHLDLGRNPIDAKARVEGLSNFKIDANVVAKLNLADLSKMFPMPGITVRGLFGLNATAKGVYNASSMPNLAAKLTLTNGYAKSKEFPEALDKLTLDASVTNTTGDYKDSEVHVKNLSWTLDNKPFSVKANVVNFADVTYDAQMKGVIDLAKVTHIYPLEGMSLAGVIRADITTAGKMSYIDKEQYDKLPTSGEIDINKFSFVSKEDLPQGFKITEAITKFTPKTITLEKFHGFAGKSDIHATGTISNYIPYVFKGHTIKGNVVFKSRRFVVDEWMDSTEGETGKAGNTTITTTTTSSDGSSTTVSDEVTLVTVPKNIDFVLNSQIDEVDYEDLEIKNIKGKIIVKDGRVLLNGLKFNMLEGGFTMSGAYDTYDVTHPKYDFKMNINRLSIGKAHSSFSVVKKLIPMAENITGFLSTNLKVSGGLSQYMTPLLDNSLNGFGSIKLTQTQVKGSGMLKNLSMVTGIQELKELNIAGVNIQTEIKNGKMTYQPFDLKVGNYNLNVRGSNDVDGTLNFKVDIDAPKGKIGQSATTAISRLAGVNFDKSDRVNVKLGITGPVNDPKIKVIGSSVQDQVKKVVDDKIEEGKDKAKEVLADAQKRADAIMAEARQKVDAAKAEARKKLDEAKKQADAEYNKFVAAKLNEVQNPLLKAAAKKVAEKTGTKIKQKAYSRAEHEFQKQLQLSNKIIETAEARRKKVLEEANQKVENINKKK
ncbi:AsmA family protein [uncultured Microscilla sp.]|uniref:AsmA family protein n=1 Tax=uncultured Microscilla sp. TaxID=432653 RepID=UPI00262B6D81|nr:AsmA family protein [uncultured Microscilla sp.]